MAVIQSSNEASWESFPAFYQESPFFTLDESILFSSQASDQALELGYTEEDTPVEGNVVFKDVPGRVHVPRSEAASCRELLLVPWYENHLSSFKCGFLNIFSRQNLLRSLSSLLFLLR